MPVRFVFLARRRKCSINDSVWCAKERMFDEGDVLLQRGDGEMVCVIKRKNSNSRNCCPKS